MSQTQAESLSNGLKAASGPTTGVKVIIPSELTLTFEQEERMLAHFRNRLQDLESDLGRTDFQSQDWLTMPTLDIRQSSQSFMGRRHLAHMVAQQRMEWRPYLLGGLYKESNLHLPITARIITQQSARAQKSFFGTAPYFSIAGLSTDSAAEAEEINAWARHELETQSNIGSQLEQAIDLAFIQGECVVKTRRHKLISYFEGLRTVAIDPATSQPFVAQDGDYIYQTDLFVREVKPVLDPETGATMIDETGAPAMEETGQMVLKRDGVTPQPAPDMANLFQTIKLNLSQVLADKVEAKPIYYLDFLCPLGATDVQSADVCFHLYDSQVIEMATKYLTDEAFGQDPTEQLNRLQRLVGELLPGNAEDEQSAGDKSRAEMGEAYQSSGRSKTEPVVAMAEGWGWYDPFGDGVMRSIMVLMDKTGRIPIYYNYVSNITPDGLRPLDVVRINPPSGRWHGQGNVERFWNLQIYIDLLVNRALFAESRAARVDFWNPSLTVEGANNPSLKLNWGGSYTIKDPKHTAKDVLQSVYLENIKNANLQNMLQMVLQMAQNMSGVTNVNDGAMAGMDTAKLATGIRNLESSGEEMFYSYITQLRPALESIMRRALKLTLREVQNQKSKILKFFDRQSLRMLEIDPLRLQDLDLDVSLDLTTYKGQTSLQQAQLGYQIMSGYRQKHPIMQRDLQPFVKQSVQTLEFKDADAMSQPTSMDDWMTMYPPAVPELPAEEAPPPVL
jgi:hypothetical protein